MFKSAVFLLALASVSAAFSAPAITSYKAVSHAQDPYGGSGGQETNMGKHDYCALSYVMSGGFNSACAIQRRGGNWILIARDPEAPDPWTGESQVCMANCFDFYTNTGEPPPPPGGGNGGVDRSSGVPDLSGNWSSTWKAAGIINDPCCMIEQNGRELTLKNPKYNWSVRAVIEQDGTIVPTDGNAGRVTRDGNRIDWSNNSFWERR